MKKITTLLSICILAGCNAYHTGRIGINSSNPEMDFVPKEAKISVDTNNKLTGSAECSSFLWIFNSVPERQTYGVSIQANDGNFASSECIAAAVYDAMKNSDADAMYGLQYTAVRSGFLCFGDRCFNGNTKIIVKGYPGKITSITDSEHRKSKDKTQTKNGFSLF